MKNTFIQTTIIIGCIVLLFSGCHKEALRDEAGNVITPAQSHCFNGTLDGDEVGVDCGGTDCDPCNEVDPPCTVPSNTLVVNSTNYAITGISSSISGSDFVISGTAGTKSITIKVPNPPGVTYIYNLAQFTTSAYTGTIYITNLPGSGGPEWITEGDLYFNSASGCYTATLCDSYYWGTSSSYSLDLSITCP